MIVPNRMLLSLAAIRGSAPRAVLAACLLLAAACLVAPPAPAQVRAAQVFGLTESEAHEMSQLLARHCTDLFGVSGDARLVGYLEGIAARVQTGTKLSGRLGVLLIESDEVNAFVSADSTIFIFRGLLRFARSREEIAGVFAHEMAHVQNKDVDKALEYAERAAEQTGDSKLKGIVDRVRAAIVGKHESREAEFRADQYGVDFLLGAGMPPDGLASFLRRMQETIEQGQKLGGAARIISDLMASHPETAERVKRLEAYVKEKNGPLDARRHALDLAPRNDGAVLVGGLAFPQALARFDQKFPLSEAGTRWTTLGEMKGWPGKDRASLGQASLRIAFQARVNGQDCVMKVIHPDAPRLVYEDIDIYDKMVAELDSRPDLHSKFGIENPRGEFNQIVLSLLEELDSGFEIRYSAEYEKGFDKKNVTTSKVYAASRNVVVEQLVRGKELYPAVREYGLDGHEVAATLTREFMRQIFVTGFFHADPHDGNIFVSENGQTFFFIDKGLMDRLPSALRDKFFELLMLTAVADRTGRFTGKLAETLTGLGYRAEASFDEKKLQAGLAAILKDRSETLGQKLNAGLCCLVPPFRRRTPHPFTVANALMRASYVSLQSALGHWWLIPEAAPTPPLRTRRFFLLFVMLSGFPALLTKFEGVNCLTHVGTEGVRRKFFVGFKSSNATTLVLESTTLRVLLSNQGVRLPGRSTLTELANAVSLQTRERILDAQLCAVLHERWDDFKTLTQDSTAVEGNAGSLQITCSLILPAGSNGLPRCGCKRLRGQPRQEPPRQEAGRLPPARSARSHGRPGPRALPAPATVELPRRRLGQRSRDPCGRCRASPRTACLLTSAWRRDRGKVRTR